MQYDKLKIEYTMCDGDVEPFKRLIPFLWINDECISKRVTVDMRVLVASIQGSGEYEILTCSCGESGCAGIWEGIIVIHRQESIQWLIPHADMNQNACNIAEQENIVKFKMRVFAKSDYINAIADAIETAKNMASQFSSFVETVPHGFSVDELLNMHVEKMFGINIGI